MKLWSIATCKEIRSLRRDTAGGDPIHSAAFSRDGRSAISAGLTNDALTLWDVATGKVLRTFRYRRGGRVTSAALSPDGRFALSGGGEVREGEIRLWDAATGEELRSFKGHTSKVTSVVFSSDGRFVLSGSWDGTLKLWDVATGNTLQTFSEQGGDVFSRSLLLWSPLWRFRPMAVSSSPAGNIPC